MNSVGRVSAVVTGKIPDRVPVSIHHHFQAAHEFGVYN